MEEMVRGWYQDGRGGWEAGGSRARCGVVWRMWWGEGRQAVSLAAFCLRLPALVWHLFSLAGETHQSVAVSPPSVLGVDDILTSPGVSTRLPTPCPAPQTAVQSLQDPGGGDGVTHAIAGAEGNSVGG